MERVTLNDLTNENAYTYAQMLRKYKDKINEIIAYVTNITPDYQHSIELHRSTEDDDGNFTLSFSFKNNDKNTYNWTTLIDRYKNDGVRFTASGKLLIDGSVHDIDYIIVDDVCLGIGFVENNSVGGASSYIEIEYEDIEHSTFNMSDNVNIL